MNRCIRLTDQSIVTLATSCPFVSELYVRGCSNITDTSLQAASTHLRFLKYVDVSECRITNRGISALLNSGNLVSLSANRLANGGIYVTDACLHLSSSSRRNETSQLGRGTNSVRRNSALRYLALSGSKVEFSRSRPNSCSTVDLHQHGLGIINSLDLGRQFPELRLL